MADSKISALSSGGQIAPGDALVVARAGASLKVGSAGMSSLVYRYTVTGSDKTSIDTGVDTADAGSNDWTGGDLLEIALYARTDEASVRSLIVLRLNNDSSGNYDFHDVYALNASVSSDGPSLAQTSWGINVNGASCAANYFSSGRMTMPNYAGTTGYKRADYQQSLGDSTAANVLTGLFAIGYKSTSAVSRLSITPSTSGKKFKVGTQLLIYKRLSS